MTKHFKNKQEEEEERLEIALQFSKEGSILSLLDLTNQT